MKRLIGIYIISLLMAVIYGQNTDGIPQELYNAIVKDESPEKVKTVLENGFDVNTQDKYARTPLYIASYLHLVDIIKVLIEFGANIETPDIQGESPLNIACYGDMYSSTEMRYNTVKYLVENGAEVNSRNNKGSTGLMRAAANGQYKIAELLVEKGADITIITDNGESALRWAKRFNYLDLIELFEKNMPQKVIITKNGNVRIGPGTQFGTVGKVNDGNEFVVVNETADWYKIVLTDRTFGWISNIIIKEVIDLKVTDPAEPEGFSPVSDIMETLDEVTSGTYCLLRNLKTSTTWFLEMLSNADILEFSFSKEGVGKPTGSKIYYDRNGGFDLLMPSTKDENGNPLNPIGKNLIMYTHEKGAKYIKRESDTLSSFGPVNLDNLSQFIGVGTTIRFPSDVWTALGNKTYRNGGFTVTARKIDFLSGTEVQIDSSIYKLDLYRWIKLK